MMPMASSSSTSAFPGTEGDGAWFDKSPSEMSMKELKLAISNSGLRGQCDGFVERHEFVALLDSYLAKVQGQEDCPVCLMPANFSIKTILLPCNHRICNWCLCSIVSREYLSCTCPLCRASVSETSLAIGMKGAGLTASVLFGGYDGPDKGEILDRAEAQLREALRREPHHAGFLTTLADLVMDKGNATEAGMLCRRAIYYEPTNYAGFATLARVYTETDQPMVALHCYEKALALEENPSIMSNMVRLSFVTMPTPLHSSFSFHTFPSLPLFFLALRPPYTLLWAT